MEKVNRMLDNYTEDDDNDDDDDDDDDDDNDDDNDDEDDDDDDNDDDDEVYNQLRLTSCTWISLLRMPICQTSAIPTTCSVNSGEVSEIPGESTSVNYFYLLAKKS